MVVSRYNFWVIPLKHVIQAVDALDGKASLGRSVSKPGDLAVLVSDGIPETALITFISRVTGAYIKDPPTCLADLFERNSTLNRSVPVLTMDAGHALIRVVYLFVDLCDRFDGETQAANFLLTEHPELDNASPAVAAMTEPGLQSVEEIVARGDHGLPA